MKVGDIKKDESMQLIASGQEWNLGRVCLNHPRCGRVVIERPKDKGLGADWAVTEVEKPDEYQQPKNAAGSKMSMADEKRQREADEKLLSKS